VQRLHQLSSYAASRHWSVHPTLLLLLLLPRLEQWQQCLDSKRTCMIA
jgi:hypothetical protein